MKRINENQKVTLTIGQLKRLVKESAVEPIKVPIGFIKQLVKCGAAEEIFDKEKLDDLGVLDSIAYSMGTYGMSAKLAHPWNDPKRLVVINQSLL